MGFDWVWCHSFSARPETPAANMDGQIAPDEIFARARRIKKELAAQSLVTKRRIRWEAAPAKGEDSVLTGRERSTAEFFRLAAVWDRMCMASADMLDSPIIWIATSTSGLRPKKPFNETSKTTPREVLRPHPLYPNHEEVRSITEMSLHGLMRAKVHYRPLQAYPLSLEIQALAKGFTRGRSEERRTRAQYRRWRLGLHWGAEMKHPAPGLRRT